MSQDPLNRTHIWLSIIATLVTLVGTIGSGIYWWMRGGADTPPTIVVHLPGEKGLGEGLGEKASPAVTPVDPPKKIVDDVERSESKSPKVVPSEKTGPVAPPKKKQPNEEPKKDSPNDDPPKKEQAKEEQAKKEQPKKEQPKPTPVDPNATPVWAEDFSEVAVGDLPQGWRGKGFAVMQGGAEGTRLEAASAGAQTLSIPKLPLKGSFFLEMNIGIADRLDITLEGAGGTRDLPLSIWPTTSGTTATVELPGGDAQTIGELIYGRRSKLRLERQGDIYRVFVNGSLAIARRLAGYGDFASARLAFDVPLRAKGQVFEVRTGPIKNASADAAGQRKDGEVYREDFEDAEIGGLPAGWEGSPEVSVVEGGKAGTRLEVSTKGVFAVKLDTPRLDAGFFVEMVAEFGGGNNKIALNLQGADGGKTFALGMHPSTSGTTLTVYPPGAQPIVVAGWLVGRKGTVRLERQGSIYRFLVNGKEVFARKLAGYGAFQGLQLQFVIDQRDTNCRLYALSVGPLKS